MREIPDYGATGKARKRIRGRLTPPEDTPEKWTTFSNRNESSPQKRVVTMKLFLLSGIQQQHLLLLEARGPSERGKNKGFLRVEGHLSPTKIPSFLRGGKAKTLYGESVRKFLGQTVQEK